MSFLFFQQFWMVLLSFFTKRKSSLEDLFPLKFTQIVTIKAKSQTSFFDQIYIHTWMFSEMLKKIESSDVAGSNHESHSKSKS